MTHPADKPANVMRLDLHCHSEASADCITPLEQFPVRCREQGIDVQAITDHNEIWGAQRLKELAGDDLTVIVGEEVSTSEGEIIGLFLKEKIPKGLSPEETVAEIKVQGGLVLLPHGFDPAKRYRLRPEARQRIENDIDIVEVFNTRVSRRKWNLAASRWALTHGLPASGGSDAHTLKDIGSAWTDVPARTVDTPESLLEVLQNEAARVDGEWTHPAVALAYKGWDFLRDRYRRVGKK